MKRKSFIWMLIVICICDLLYICLDFSDVISRVGLFGHLNINVLALVFNNTIILILFLITYYLIDSRNIEANNHQIQILENKRNVGLHYIEKTVSNCEEMVNLLTPEVVENYVVPKVDFNSPSNLGVAKNIKDSPFIFEEQLYSLFTDGSLLNEELDLYLELKKNYQGYIDTIITFFDAPELHITIKKRYEQTIKNIKQYLQAKYKKGV